jgi:hypothetical protein
MMTFRKTLKKLNDCVDLTLHFLVEKWEHDVQRLHPETHARQERLYQALEAGYQERPLVDPTELRAAYREAARKHHPDRGGDLETMRLVNHAYENADLDTLRALV